MHTLAIAPLRTESPLQKRSGTARVLKGFHSFTCTPTRSSAIGMSHTCLCLPSYNWYSFTDPGRLSRPWMTAVRKICVVTKRYHRRNVDILITEGATNEKIYQQSYTDTETDLFRARQSHGKKQKSRHQNILPHGYTHTQWPRGRPRNKEKYKVYHTPLREPNRVLISLSKALSP